MRILGYDAETLRDAEYPGYRKLESPAGAPLRLAKNPDYKPLGVDPFQAVRDVEMALGIGIEGAFHLDNIPRPADYVAVFEPLRKDATVLLKSVTALGGYYRDQIKLKGGDVHKIEQAIGSLFDISTAILKEFRSMPSPGRRKEVAIYEVIRRLRFTFHKFYRGPVTARKRTGAISALAEQERQELAFVRGALIDAGIIKPPYAAKLPRLLRDLRSAIAEPGSNPAESRAIKPKKTRQQK